MHLSEHKTIEMKPLKNLRPSSHMKSQIYFVVAIVMLIAFEGCESKKSDTATPSKTNEMNKKDLKTADGEPAFITVQHCLIGFEGSVPGKPIRRTKEEAKELAEKLLGKLKEGDDFKDIIRQFTDDSPPGIYRMANRGFRGSDGVYNRDEMVPAFGDTGFPLEVGEYGLAEYDPMKSPYGWHIVLRVE